MFLELLVGVLTVLFVLDYAVRYRRNALLKLSKILGPPSVPFLGNALSLRGLDSENLINYLQSLVRDYGKTTYMWILHRMVLFSADPKVLEILLSSQVHLTKHLGYDMLRCWLGDGLLMSTGKKWHSRRKIITPTFHFKILEQFVDIFDRQSSILVDNLQSKADGATAIDIFPRINLSALDIIAESAMGVQIGAQMNPDLPYVKAVKTVTELVAERMRRPAWRLDWLFRLVAFKAYDTMFKSIEIMHEFTDNVITKRRVELEKSNSLLQSSLNAEEEEIGSKKRMALLDVLLQATVDEKPLSNDDIREEVETFMFEGHDTTTSGISFTLYLIARHRDVQEKLFSEILDIMGPDKALPVSYRKLQELKYMECVIKESLRFYPPVPIIGRYLTQDFKIKDKIIPANTQVSIPLFIVLRDPEYFPDPDAFKPERFEGDNIPINAFAYTPFSAGPRNCIGQKFSMLEMKSIISKMLRHYELLPLGPDVRPSLNLVMRSISGMNIGLRPRNYDKFTELSK